MAWAVFDERYSPLLRQFFRSFGVHDDSARDMVQETIERAIASLKEKRYERKKGRLRDWMAGIARNVLREAASAER